MAILGETKAWFAAWFAVAVLGLALPCSAHAQTAARDWAGTYTYEDDLGYDGGGTADTGAAMIVDYRLVIDRSGKCDLTVEGYQTDEAILCGVTAKAGGVAISFRSFQNGSVLNQYGVAEYGPGAVLFTLSKTAGEIVTGWDALHDDPPLAPGRYFVRAGAD